jgi:hypothetical protein
MSSPSHIAGFRLAVASAGDLESQPIANFDCVRIYSRSLQLIDVQKHIRTAGVLCDKSEAAVGIPHFSFPAPILFSHFQPELDQTANAGPVRAIIQPEPQWAWLVNPIAFWLQPLDKRHGVRQVAKTEWSNRRTVP